MAYVFILNISNLVFSSEVGDEAILKALLERYLSAVDEVCLCNFHSEWFCLFRATKLNLNEFLFFFIRT